MKSVVGVLIFLSISNLSLAFDINKSPVCTVTCVMEAADQGRASSFLKSAIGDAEPDAIDKAKGKCVAYGGVATSDKPHCSSALEHIIDHLD